MNGIAKNLPEMQKKSIRILPDLKAYYIKKDRTTEEELMAINPRRVEFCYNYASFLY